MHITGSAELLNAFSASFWPVYSCTDSLTSCFYQHDALGGLIWMYVAVSVYCLVFAELSGNYSKVDQIWSVTPWVYCWYLLAHWQHNHAGETHERLLLLCVLTSIWGFRLTYNFWRRDGYGNLITHEEDYRWPILRKKINNRFLFSLFNATFIAPYQNLILLLIALPAYHVMNGESSCNWVDIVLGIAFLFFIAMETIADQQHWNFHKKKYSVTAQQRKLHPDQDVKDGFFQSGLFKFSRHPNYFAEQSVWMVIYLFSLTHTTISSAYDLFNVYFLGELLLISLFQGSIAFGESITISKYPKYKDYQSRTNMCFPFFPEERKKSA